MGYYTWITLSTYGEDAKIKQMEADAKVYEDDLVSKFIEDQELEVKWAYFEDSLMKFMRRHPEVLFVVYGDGEESDDIWEARFKGEEFELHCLEMPPFTNPKLKIPLKYLNQ